MISKDQSPIEPTRVIFRVFKDGGDVLALFPDIQEGPGQCLSYQHVGQHGAADLSLRTDDTTRAAVAAGYADLLQELRAIGYTLDVTTS